MNEWPCTGSELTRRLGLPHDRHNVRRVVRPLLTQLGCPKKHPYERAEFDVDQTTARRVAEILNRPLT